jgi:hypothetical protein
MQKLKILLVFSAVALLLPEPAWAYLDPGTGTILLQALIASVVGGFALIGIYWRKLKSALGFGERNASTSDSEPTQRDT